jgi:hypothetical protein
MSLNILFEGKPVAFLPSTKEDFVGKSVVCPICAKDISRSHAKRHYGRCLTTSKGDNDVVSEHESDGEALESNSRDSLKRPQDNQESSLFSKKSRKGISDIDIYNKLYGNIPAKFFQSIMESMSTDIYKIYRDDESNEGNGMILTPESFQLLQSILPQEYHTFLLNMDTPRAIDQELMTLKNFLLKYMHTIN